VPCRHFNLILLSEDVQYYHRARSEVAFRCEQPRLAELSFSGGGLRDLADDTVSVLRRNTINLFSGAMAECRRNLRSLQVLLDLVERHYSSPLMQAVSEAVILYSV
jgi:hypothetical protein